MAHCPFFRHRPNADIAILMIHGILGTPRHFDWLIHATPDHIHISNILLPGHGGSVQDFSDSTMKQWQNHVAQAICDLERPGRKIIVIGHSLGSLLALNAAQQHKSIRGLILLNVPFCPQVRLRLVGRSIRAAFGKSNLDDPAEIVFLQACGTKTEPYLWKYLGWIPNFLALLSLCRKSRLVPQALTIPCYAYLGKKDDLVHIRSARWLQNLPNIQLRFFPDGSHFGYSQQEQSQIRDDLCKLLQSVSKNQAQ